MVVTLALILTFSPRRRNSCCASRSGVWPSGESNRRHLAVVDFHTLFRRMGKSWQRGIPFVTADLYPSNNAPE